MGLFTKQLHRRSATLAHWSTPPRCRASPTGFWRPRSAPAVGVCIEISSRVSEGSRTLTFCVTGRRACHVHHRHHRHHKADIVGLEHVQQERSAFEVRNFSLEARDDRPFHHRASEARVNQSSYPLRTGRLSDQSIGHRSLPLNGQEENRTPRTDFARISRPLGTCLPGEAFQ
jgi:hypothetical protein